jgi:tetratricopeptide (TPR) repeat protein
MPSLNALKEFRDSFNNLAGEKEVLANRNQPFNDLELPDTEPVPLETPPAGASDAEETPAEAPSSGEFDNAPPDEDSALDGAGGGDFDFSDFLDTTPTDITPPPIDDILPSDDLEQEAAESPEPAAGNFDIPDDLLSGLSDELEAGSPDFADEAPDNGGEDFDLGDESAEGSPDLGGENFDLGGETPDFDIPDTEPSAESTDSLDLGNESFDLGSEDLNIDNSGTETGEAMVAEGAEVTPDSPVSGSETDVPAGDGFDNFSLGEDNATPDFGEETTPAEDQNFGDDFSLDDLFDKGAKAKSKGKAKTKTKTKIEKTEEVEEIQLSQDDLDNFRKTLSSYPLNLRIACEELIAEQVLAPEQLSKLVRFLVNGASVRETANLAGQLLGKDITIPRSFEKSTGEALEAEQASFAYIFVHNFLPVLRIFSIIAVLAASVFYLGYKFIYTPIKAESIYKRGYERIFAGEYQRANDLFREAFRTHRKKSWFYQYAEGFRDQRRYMLAEEKYDELLRYYPRDKKGVLDYAALETNYLMNYEKADKILLRELLDYAPNDADGLLAQGDNSLAWADSDPVKYADKYEEARYAYARLLTLYGWQAPVVERMMKYFIRTDNLKEVLPLIDWFESSSKRQLSAPALAELGGYLLDKQLEEVRGVPNEYVESIQGVRALLLQAVRLNPSLPEPHYHLARYYNNLGNIHEERITLENAIRAFDNAKEESIKRRMYRIDTHLRYANLLINNKEFFPAEEQLVRGINLYEDFLSRRLISSSPLYGKLYAGLGDLEYFVKTGNMNMALNYYHRSEQNGWAPPEIQYRMGAAYYQLEDWRNALEYLFKASAELPLNSRLLFALGNSTLKRGDYFAALGYYNRLLDILENQRSRLPVLLPNDRPEFLELGERLMMARNNAGVACEALAGQTGNNSYRSRALALYAESARAWDSITRNPETMIRLRPSDGLNTPGVNLGFLNANNALRPAGPYEPVIFIRIDKDVLEPSRWEELAPAVAY